MSRLIDADKLIEQGWVLKMHGQSNELIYTKSLADVPTAYDVEAVVEELEEQAKLYHRMEKDCENKNVTVKLSDKFHGKACSYEHATEIVRSGGVI